MLWGVYHGAYVLFSHLTSGLRHETVELLRLSRMPRLHAALRILVTFHLATFAWIFFSRPHHCPGPGMWSHTCSRVSAGGPQASEDLTISCWWCWPSRSWTVHAYEEWGQTRHFLGQHEPGFVRWPVYVTIALVILLFGIFEETQFIYFQF